MYVFVDWVHILMKDFEIRKSDKQYLMDLQERLTLILTSFNNFWETILMTKTL